MIDEKTTQISKPAKASRDLKSSLRKRAPIESLSTSAGVNPSISPQEPRRPRFSFFYLHNVKELTKSPSPVNLVVGSNRLQHSQANAVSSLVTQQLNLLVSEIRQTVGATSAQRR